MICLQETKCYEFGKEIATIFRVLTKSIGSKSGSLILQEELSPCGEEIVSI